MPDWEKELHAALDPRYRLIRRLGKGGTSIVFLATDIQRGRGVALKVLRPELANSVTIHRFAREVALVGRLVHPNILALLDSGEAAGLPYFVAPYVDGQSLAARLARDGPMPVEEAVHLACEVADALDYANAAGVIHRDVKPANVLQVAQHAIVADFGAGWVMRLAPDEERTTDPGIIIGTMGYMSPEQAAGERYLDGRSDEYSLAVSLHELLAGSLPFSGANARQIMAKRFTSAAVPLRQVREDVPEALERVALRALAFEPDARFPTVGEFRDELRQAIAPRGAHVPASTVPVPQARLAFRASGRGPSIAVLPFASLSADPEDEYLGLGVAEEITTALARLRALRVVARTSVRHGQREADDVRVVGQRLGATVVLGGSVQRALGRILLTARLVTTADGHQLWSKQFVRDATDLFALQEDLAQSVVAALEVDLLGQSGRALIGVPTPLAAAHDLYLRGRFAWNKRTEAQLEQSIRLFDAAVEMDPEFAAAHAAKADAYLTSCVYGVRAPREAIPLARRATERALELDPTAPASHVAAAQILSVHEWNWSAAEQEFVRAITLDPDYSAAHHSYAVNLLAPLGRHDEALASATRALQLDKLSAVLSASVGVVLFAARRYEDSIHQYEQTLELEPNFGLAHFLEGQALTQLDAFERAIASFERAIALSGRRFEIVSALAHASARAGNLSRASELLGELEDAAATRYVSPYLIAQVHLGFGADDVALVWLQRAVDERAAELTWLGVRGVWDPLRDTDGFQAVSRTVLGTSGIDRARRSERYRARSVKSS